MRGLPGRHARSVAIGSALGLVVLGASAAVVVAVAGHRAPAVTPGRPPVTGPTASAVAPAPARTPAPAAAHGRGTFVLIDEGTTSLTVQVGALIEVRLHGNLTDRWREPGTSSPRILQRLSAAATPDGNATGTFEAVAAGEAFILIERSSACSSGPTGGVCGAEARRISVTVTG
ncbi:MAG: hypothetical protein QOG45_2178 [Chloroflexota bacterium]|jgi:hypothetical protein|nr:hypothetical protein [Chloroflexota bacterium]